jgi:hypothetical protein
VLGRVIDSGVCERRAGAVVAGEERCVGIRRHPRREERAWRDRVRILDYVEVGRIEWRIGFRTGIEPERPIDHQEVLDVEGR